jgi:hypothetical protein
MSPKLPTVNYTMQRRTLLVVVLSAFGLFNCECEPTLNRVAPKIEVADVNDETASPCAELGIRDCSYDFGEVPIGQARFFRFLVKNPSPVDLVLKDIFLSDDSDPGFALAGTLPTKVSAQLGEEGEQLTVQFTPLVQSAVSGELFIVSDAVNLDPNEDVVLSVRGSGKDLGGPLLVVDPAACDFGDVGVGVTSFCDLTIENVGQRELLVDSVAFGPDTSTTVFGAASVFPIPTAIQPGTGVSLRLFAQPSAPGVVSGVFLLGSTDPQNPEVQVPLSVNGAQAPTAVARVKSVNGTLVQQSSPSVRPLDDVVLTGTDSQAAVAGKLITSYAWTIVQKPVESSIQLTQPGAMETGFFFSSSGGNYQGLDVAGTFVVRLEVTDEDGLTSTNDARVTLNAVPSERLHVQLTWDTPVNDIDLHLIRGSGPYCSAQSCYYANCKPTSFNRPNWDGLPGHTAGDPTLDVDDLGGYGPENINIDQPIDSTYTVGVHFYSGNQPNNSTLKIFVNGGLAYEATRLLSSSDDFWEVAQIQWSQGAAIVVPVNGYQSNWNCP